jgi:hypothetical protein
VSGAGGVEALLAGLEAAAGAAAARAGRAPAGVRAVEPGPRPGGPRWYLCAFEGPAFLCLAGDLVPEPDPGRVREVVMAGLVWEHAEEMVEAGALHVLAGVAEGLAGGGDPHLAGAGAVPHLAELTIAARAFAGWREAPERALASLPQLDAAAAHHERVRRAYGGFVAATDPLVAVQDGLPGDLVQMLRALEEAAGAAGVGEALAPRIAAVIAALEEQVDEVLATHLRPFGG